MQTFMGKCHLNPSEYTKGQFRNLNFQKDHEGTRPYLTFVNVAKRLKCPL